MSQAASPEPVSLAIQSTGRCSLVNAAVFSGKPLSPTADCHLIIDPAADNRDRGPANVFVLRLHAAV